MIQKEFIGKLAAKLQWDESDTSVFIQTVSNILNEQLADNNMVTIENFGVFSTQKNQEYILLNSETGERYLMPPEVVVLFEPYADQYPENAEQVYNISFETDNSLKRTINSAFQNFEPTLIKEGVEFPGIPVITTEEPEPEIEEPEAEEVPEVKEPEIEPEPEVEVPETEVFTKTEDSLIEPDLKIVYAENEGHSVIENSLIEPDPEIKETKLKEKLVTEHTQKRLKPKPRSRKSSRVMIPVLGGVAIVLATLFFFNGVAKRKSCKSDN